MKENKNVPNNVCRWGILSTSTIARKNWQAMQLAENATVVAVASREKARSDVFVARCQAEAPFRERPIALGSYQELLERDDVDAVYIPLPTGLRKSWVINAAEAGKHVLCEKPCAINSAHLGEMLAACEQNNVQFMDGVMFMHSKRLSQLRAAIDDPDAIGRIRRIHSQFSFLADRKFRHGDIRMDQRLEPLGCLGDLGWYCIRFTLWVMDWKLPTHVRAKTLTHSDISNHEASVPTELVGELLFDDGVSAGFYCSFEAANQECCSVSGSKGYLEMDDFVLPFQGNEISFETNQSEYVVENCRFEMRSHQQQQVTVETSNNAMNAQETNMIRNFSEIVLNGTVDKSWFMFASKTQLIVDACIESASDCSKLIEIPEAQL